MSASIAFAALLAASFVAAAGARPAANRATSPLAVAVASYDVAYVPLYYGVAKGFFRDAGVDLTIVQAGAQTAASVISGQTDILGGGAPNSYALINQGQSIKFIRMSWSGGLTGFVAGKPAYTSIKDCKTLATFTPGTSTYAWSAAYKNLNKLNDTQLQSATAFSDIPAMLASGRADCATGTYGALSPLVASGTAKWLIDTRQGVPAAVSGLPDSGFSALTSTIKSKRAALIGFLKAYNRSVAEIKAAPAATVANYVHDNVDGYKTQTVDRLTDALAAYKWFFSPNNGYLEKWRYYRMLNYLIGAGLDYIPAPKQLDTKGVRFGYDASNKFSYQNDVDMSLLKAAQAKRK